MPFHFKIDNDISKYEKFKSVLIIPCRFCPAASSAITHNKPYIEFFRHFLKTDSYEKYIQNLASNLKKRGIKTAVFRSRLIHQFVLCMWTSKRRKHLQKKANEYEALVVLGCEAATKTVRDSVKSASCAVLQGLETEGVMSIKPRLQPTGNLSLELESMTRLVCLDNQPVKANS